MAEFWCICLNDRAGSHNLLCLVKWTGHLHIKLTFLAYYIEMLNILNYLWDILILINILCINCRWWCLKFVVTEFGVTYVKVHVNKSWGHLAVIRYQPDLMCLLMHWWFMNSSIPEACPYKNIWVHHTNSYKVKYELQWVCCKLQGNVVDHIFSTFLSI